MERLLLVEDDAALVKALRAYLESAGFQIRTAGGQKEAAAAMDEESPDLALVDISLSDGNGFGVLAYAREKGLPVIFLTAYGDEYSVVTGLDNGAEDYIAKPCRPRELVSRIRNVLRRHRKTGAAYIFGSLQVYPEKGIATRDGRDLYLSALEYKLLMTLIMSEGRILTREMLLSEIWDSTGEYVTDNTLSVYIRRLRAKIEDDPQEPAHIITVRGLGYRWETSSSPA